MKLRRRAQFYLATSVLAAAALQAYCIWAWRTQWQGGGSGPTPPNLSVAALLVGLAVLAQHFPLEAGPRRKVDLAVAVYFASLLLFGTPVGMALVGGAQLLGQGTLALRRDGATGRQRSTPRAVLFNAAQYVLATGLGGLTYYAFVPQVAPATLDRIENLWAIPCAAAAVYLTNSWSVALMVGLQRGTNPARVWLSGRGAD